MVYSVYLFLFYYSFAAMEFATDKAEICQEKYHILPATIPIRKELLNDRVRQHFVITK